MENVEQHSAIDEKAQENLKLMNYISELEGGQKEKSATEIKSDKPSFVIISESELTKTARFPDGLPTDDLITDNVASEMIGGTNGVEFYDRTVVGINAIDDEHKLYEEGFVDVKTHKDSKYVRPDYYIVISREVQDQDSVLVKAKIMSLASKSEVGECQRTVKVNGDRIVENSLQDFKGDIQNIIENNLVK